MEQRKNVDAHNSQDIASKKVYEKEEREEQESGSYMYYDYRKSQNGESALSNEVKKSHERAAALWAKADAKRHGKAGRFRGKSGTHENNKARGGKKAM